MPTPIARSSRSRNLSFTSDINEVGTHLEFYPFRSDRIVSPYVTVGFAAFQYDPQTTFQGETVSLRELGTEGQGLPGFGDRYGEWAVALPLGGGLRFNLGDRVHTSASKPSVA